METETLKTGTTTVGIVCKDGIVLATDKRATAGSLIVNKEVDKIATVTDKMALTISGSVSDIQLLVKIIRAEMKIKELRTYREVTTKEVANFISGMVYDSIRQYVPGVAHFILAGTDNKGCSLYDIFPDGSLAKYEEYVCSGSGSIFSYGILDAIYKKNLGLKEGIALAVQAVNAGMKRDTGSGNGINIMTLTKSGCERLTEKELSVYN